MPVEPIFLRPREAAALAGLSTRAILRALRSSASRRRSSSSRRSRPTLRFGELVGARFHATAPRKALAVWGARRVSQRTADVARRRRSGARWV
jgi:hypothetical protein